MVKKQLSTEQIRKRTPATERWVNDALRMTGAHALDSVNNAYAYMLRCFELRFPKWAGILIPLFSRHPHMPWWAR